MLVSLNISELLFFDLSCRGPLVEITEPSMLPIQTTEGILTLRELLPAVVQDMGVSSQLLSVICKRESGEQGFGHL
jgi:hypothetical protein